MADTPHTPFDADLDPTVRRVPLTGPRPRPGDSLVGMKLGEYLVEAYLGEGGMGVVYRGIQPDIGKKVAVKVLKPRPGQELNSLEELQAEARAVNAIRHPAIVDIFGFGKTPDGQPYVVMELLEGESLDAVMREAGRMQPLELLDILEQIASALSAAHAAGIVHRDLKPANIHLERLQPGVWRVKLLDFGMAKHGDPGADSIPQTRQDVVRGTPEYMAPEQAKAQPVSAQTDLYAVGVIAFEALTGRLPFIADNPIEIVMKHIREEPPRPTSIEPGISDELETLVLQLLAKEPVDRPESATALRRSVLKLKKQLMEGSTVIRRLPTSPPSVEAVTTPALDKQKPAPAPPTTETSLRASPERSRLVTLGGAGAMLVLLGVVAFVLWPKPEAQVDVPDVTPPTIAVEPVVPVVVPVKVDPPAGPDVSARPTEEEEEPTIQPLTRLPVAVKPREPRAPTNAQLLTRIEQLQTRVDSGGEEIGKTAPALLRKYRLSASGVLDAGGRRELAGKLDQFEVTFHLKP